MNPEPFRFRTFNTDINWQEITPMEPAPKPAPVATEPKSTTATGYASLRAVLNRAYDQAATGKGAERHAQGQAFEHQPMQHLIALYGQGFALGQAAKKAQESMRMEPEAAVRELLGAINYLAGAVISLESKGAGRNA